GRAGGVVPPERAVGAGAEVVAEAAALEALELMAVGRQEGRVRGAVAGVAAAAGEGNAGDALAARMVERLLPLGADDLGVAVVGDVAARGRGQRLVGRVGQVDAVGGRAGPAIDGGLAVEYDGAVADLVVGVGKAPPGLGDAAQVL